MKKYVINVNGNRYDVEVEEIEGDFSEVSMTTTSPVDKVDTKQATNTKEIKKSTAQGQKVECPMPGTILSINTKVGESIRKGDVLFVLEAMKMENEIMAPDDGRIIELNIVKGAQVKTGDVLAVIE